MKIRSIVPRASLPVVIVIGLVSLGLALTEAGSTGAATSPSEPLNVQAESSQGFAAPGNIQSANVLVTVNDASGSPVVDLTQSDFQVVEHFPVPGQPCGFTNRITSFGNIGTGAYQIQIEVGSKFGACVWVAGDYLGQVMVADGSKRGQTPFKLIVR